MRKYNSVLISDLNAGGFYFFFEEQFSYVKHKRRGDKHLKLESGIFIHTNILAEYFNSTEA